MKRFSWWPLIFLAFVLFCAAAEAGVVGKTPQGYIHMLQTPAGSDICFLSPDAEAIYKMEDVNFDGAEDIVVFVKRGASNDFAEFFIWNGADYVWAEHEACEGGIVNYTLLPDRGMVLSKENDGVRDFSAVLLCWAGEKLEPVRFASTAPYTEILWENNAYIEKTYLHKAVARVYEGEKVLMEEIFPSDEETVCAVYERQMALLMKGAQ